MFIVWRYGMDEVWMVRRLSFLVGSWFRSLDDLSAIYSITSSHCLSLGPFVSFLISFVVDPIFWLGHNSNSSYKALCACAPQRLIALCTLPFFFFLYATVLGISCRMLIIHSLPSCQVIVYPGYGQSQVASRCPNCPTQTEPPPIPNGLTRIHSRS